jgi:hypothetical protein
MIRQKICNFYTARKEVPAVSALERDINFPGVKEFLRRVLKIFKLKK